MTDVRNGHPTSLPRPPTYSPTYPNLPTYLYIILFLSFLFGLGTFFFVFAVASFVPYVLCDTHFLVYDHTVVSLNIRLRTLGSSLSPDSD